MFRNVRFYRLDNDWPDDESAVSEALGNAAFAPCGPLTERSSGWVPPAANAGDSLARRVNGADLLLLRSQSRVLPPAAVNEQLEVRIAEFTDRMQQPPGAREKKRLKAETRDELLPQALLRSDRVWGFVDIGRKIIGVDALQPAAADRFLRRLRAAFGDLDIKPLQFREPVAGLLTRIMLGNAPGQFVVGKECRMQDAADPRSVVRWTGFDLTEKTIRNHVAEGMHLTHLAVDYDNVLNVVIDENGVLSKLRFLGMDDAGDDHDDPVARQDAEFVLITGTLRLLLADLETLLGGTGQQ